MKKQTLFIIATALLVLINGEALLRGWYPDLAWLSQYGPDWRLIELVAWPIMFVCGLLGAVMLREGGDLDVLYGFGYVALINAIPVLANHGTGPNVNLELTLVLASVAVYFPYAIIRRYRRRRQAP